MPRAPEPHIMEILKKYHPNPKAALWDCHGTWVVYHKDIELMAAKAGVRFDPPMVLEASGPTKCAALCVVGHLEGSPPAWSIGEAAPGNNKNAYPFAMAEKRAKDRVAIKLLGLHGIYSEEEADAFKTGAQPVPEESRLAMQQQSYVLLCLDVIKSFQGSATELKEWWGDEASQRMKLQIGNGTPEYEQIFNAFKDKGLSLASKSQPEGRAA